MWIQLVRLVFFCVFFFFNDTATTEIYTLSLHDALPIFVPGPPVQQPLRRHEGLRAPARRGALVRRSEEHTSELQSRPHLVCRLLLEKKKNKTHCYLYFKNNKIQ